MPASPNLKCPRLWNIYSVTWLCEVSNRSYFILEIFMLSEVTAKVCLVKAYIKTQIVSKTLLFSRSHKRQSFAWNRQQTEWNIVSKLSSSYLQKPAYGSMPLVPAETRPTIMDKGLVTLLRFWGVFQFTQVQPLPSPHNVGCVYPEFFPSFNFV